MWLFWLLVGMVVASIVWFFVWRNNKKRFELADSEVQQYVEVIEAKLNGSELAASVKMELANLLDRLKR